MCWNLFYSRFIPDKRTQFVRILFFFLRDFKFKRPNLKIELYIILFCKLVILYEEEYRVSYIHVTIYIFLNMDIHIGYMCDAQLPNREYEYEDSIMYYGISYGIYKISVVYFFNVKSNNFWIFFYFANNIQQI